MQNQRRHGIATACGLARIENYETLGSDWRTGRRDYSGQCEGMKNKRNNPQERE
jgi:hypothetical protein